VHHQPRLRPPARRSRLLKDARRQGRHNRPGAEETEPNGLESRNTSHYAREHERVNEMARNNLVTLESRFEAANPVPPSQVLDSVLEDNRAELTRLEVLSKQLVARCRRTERGLLRELRRFQREHDLIRDPQYPESSIFHYAIVALLVLLESLANAYFFAQGSDFGLLGGVFQAFLVSITNVGIGLLVGVFALRVLHHRSLLRKSLSFVVVSLFVPLTLSFNLIAAHYRDLLGANPSAIHIEVLLQTWQSPLSLSFEGFLLCAIGVCASILALFKGYTADDSYPGYGTIGRRHEASVKELEGARESAIEKLFELFGDARRTCDGILEAGKKAISEKEAIIVEIRKTGEHCARESKSIVAACHDHLRAYRDENISIRTTPPPSYFDEYPSFASTALDASLPSLLEQLEDERRSFAQRREEVAKLRHEMNELLQQRSTEFEAMLDAVISEADGDPPAGNLSGANER